MAAATVQIAAATILNQRSYMMVDSHWKFSEIWWLPELGGGRSRELTGDRDGDGDGDDGDGDGGKFEIQILNLECK
ncbi:hypothetical protein ACS0TY_025356 [Phlomoides rotata]